MVSNRLPLQDCCFLELSKWHIWLFCALILSVCVPHSSVRCSRWVRTGVGKLQLSMLPSKGPRPARLCLNITWCVHVSACHVLPQHEGSLQLGSPAQLAVNIPQSPWPCLYNGVGAVTWTVWSQYTDRKWAASDTDEWSALGTTVLSWSSRVSKQGSMESNSSLHKGSPWNLPHVSVSKPRNSPALSPAYMTDWNGNTKIPMCSGAPRSSICEGLKINPTAFLIREAERHWAGVTSSV